MSELKSTQGSTHHPPQRVHRPPQGVLDAPCWCLLRVRARRVDGAALDEHAHEDDEQDAHQTDHVPVLRDPLGDGLQHLPVEQHVLEPHQRALGVDGAAL